MCHVERMMGANDLVILHRCPPNKKEAISPVVADDIFGNDINLMKDMVKASMESLYDTIDFLKQEIIEKNIIIRALTQRGESKQDNTNSTIPNTIDSMSEENASCKSFNGYIGMHDVTTAKKVEIIKQFS